jgi:LysM repeat protein
MNTPNPLIPQGSLEAQQYQKRSFTKIVVSLILGVHGIVLGGLLFLGCKEEPKDKLAENSFDKQPLNATGHEAGSPGPFGNVPVATNDLPIQPVAINTNDPFGALSNSRDNGLNPPGRDAGFPTSPGFPPESNPTNNGPGETGFPPSQGESTKSLVHEPERSTESRQYAVLPNDNFTSIAKKHNITVKELATANPAADSRHLKVGQVLNLPANVTPVAPTVPTTNAETTAAGAIYTVKSGDTLTKIARDNKVTVKQLQQANGLRGSLIKVGQKLVIPAGGSGSK